MPTKSLTKKDNTEVINWGGVYENTPKEYIKKRTGRGNMTFDYVETGYIIKRLNELFNYRWSFDIVSEKVIKDQVMVKGKLTIYVSPELVIQNTQYGGSTVKKTREGKVISIADDLKSATSDSLKKCASWVGIASDVYWGGEVEEEEEVVKPQSVEKEVDMDNIALDLDNVEEVEAKRLDNARKEYFAVSHELGVESEKAKEFIKKRLEVESFNDINIVKLKAFTSAMRLKLKKKQEEEDFNKIFDGEL